MRARPNVFFVVVCPVMMGLACMFSAEHGLLVESLVLVVDTCSWDHGGHYVIHSFFSSSKLKLYQGTVPVQNIASKSIFVIKQLCLTPPCRSPLGEEP